MSNLELYKNYIGVVNNSHANAYAYRWINEEIFHKVVF